MKKTVLLIVLMISSIACFNVNAQSRNPIVNRLSTYEISQNSSPSAVAYNYIRCVLFQNWNLIPNYMTPDIIVGNCRR